MAADDDLLGGKPLPDELVAELERLVRAEAPANDIGYPMTDRMMAAFVEAGSVSAQVVETGVRSFHRQCRREPWPDDRAAQLAWYETLIALLIGHGWMEAPDGPEVRRVIARELERVDC